MNHNLSSETVSAAPDYSRAECWYKFPEITKDVDTFYVYATEYIMGSLEEGAPDFAELDNEEMRLGVKNEYRDHASAFADVTNVFLPYYRQSGLGYAGKVFKKTGNADDAFIGKPIDDITAALDYYFEHCNGGRPFIIAGHSQGSGIVSLVLKKYFKEHPEVAERVEAQIVAKLTGKDEPKKDDLADMRAPAPTAKAKTASRGSVEVFADDFEDDD